DGTGTASSMQNGDNTVVVDQHVAPTSGDSVAGGQVTGVVQGAGTSATTAMIDGRLNEAA
ncbi:MAG TPA: hypothetical protein VM840_06140, partial [Actinomycetota bacterium]|nr:hypothetical protein [Actinomycetota bacterium]